MALEVTYFFVSCTFYHCYVFLRSLRYHNYRLTIIVLNTDVTKKTSNRLNAVETPAELPLARTGMISPIRSHAIGPKPIEYAAINAERLTRGMYFNPESKVQPLFFVIQIH